MGRNSTFRRRFLIWSLLLLLQLVWFLVPVRDKAIVLWRGFCRREAVGREIHPHPSTVRVAAIQSYSRMGETARNRRVLTDLIQEAVKCGARIVVLPECAIQGYMDPAAQVVWTTNTVSGEGELSVLEHAEIVPGETTDYFGVLAKDLGIYLCIAMVERVSDGRCFNAQVLFGPGGNIIAHHRKRNKWPPGDGLWVSEGNLPVQVVETEYGRLGLMICYDTHVVAAELGRLRADIVLYSVGWYGPNTENWFRRLFPRDYVVPNGFSIVVANWSAPEGSEGWPGAGYSCVIDQKGRVLNMTTVEFGSHVVVADVPLLVKRFL